MEGQSSYLVHSSLFPPTTSQPIDLDGNALQQVDELSNTKSSLLDNVAHSARLESLVAMHWHNDAASRIITVRHDVMTTFHTIDYKT